MAYTLPHPTITAIPNTEPAATPNLWNTRYTEIDENFERIKVFNPVAECATAAATAAKVANCPYFVLAKNNFILVRFTVTNTAANATLNVNSTGAKPIKYRNAPVNANQLAANRAYLMVYDGTNWVIVGDLDTGNEYLRLSGGTVTGNLTINGTTTVKDPTQPQHPVTKAFFDKEMQNLDTKIGFDDLKNTADGIYKAFVEFNKNNGIE